MTTQLRKWENVALPIPEEFAAQAHLSPESVVEVVTSGNVLVVRPVAVQKPTLEELLAGITDENLHGEINTSPAVGREVW